MVRPKRIEFLRASATKQQFVKYVLGVPLVYLSIPKNGSSTISHALLSKSVLAGQSIEEHSVLGKGLTNRSGILDRWPRHPVVTFVRNPYDRFISFYQNKILGPEKGNGEEFLPHLRRLGFSPGMSIRQVADLMSRIPIEYMEHHCQPQWRILLLGDSVHPSYVGRMETFAADWEPVNTLGFRGKASLTPRNTSTQSSHISEIGLDDWTVEFLGHYYAEDFRLLGYERRGGVSEVFARRFVRASAVPSQMSLDRARVTIEVRTEEFRSLAARCRDEAAAMDKFLLGEQMVLRQFLEAKFRREQSQGVVVRSIEHGRQRYRRARLESRL